LSRIGLVARADRFLAENLRADDYTVLTAASGAEALEVLGRCRPDLVLLDVVLPDMSGFDLCRTLRDGDDVNAPWDPHTPVIMLSAKAEHTDRVRGLSRGADDYVTKAFESVERCPYCEATWFTRGETRHHGGGRPASDPERLPLHGL
jgi:DNA-binding response OmpR family regulator